MLDKPTARLRLRRAAARPLIVLLVLMATATQPEAEASPPNDPISTIETGVAQVRAVFNDRQMPLNQRREKLRAMSWQYFDFQSMAKSVLGTHWRALSTAQRQEFVPLFTEFIQDAYLSKMEQATVEKVREEAKTARVQFTGQTYFSRDYAEVYSTVALRDQNAPLAVNYLMHRAGGEWRIYDITIDAISLVLNYRNQFNRVINQRGYSALIAELQAKRLQLQHYMAQEAQDRASP